MDEWFQFLGPCELAGYTDQCCDISDGTDCQGDQHPEVCHCDTECELHGDCCSDFDLTCTWVNNLHSPDKKLNVYFSLQSLHHVHVLHLTSYQYNEVHVLQFIKINIYF